MGEFSRHRLRGAGPRCRVAAGDTRCSSGSVATLRWCMSSVTAKAISATRASRSAGSWPRPRPRRPGRQEHSVIGPAGRHSRCASCPATRLLRQKNRRQRFPATSPRACSARRRGHQGPPRGSPPSSRRSAARRLPLRPSASSCGPARGRAVDGSPSTIPAYGAGNTNAMCPSLSHPATYRGDPSAFCPPMTTPTQS